MTAVCANIRGHVKDVIFEECPGLPAKDMEAPAPAGQPADGRTVILLGSMRTGKRGNTAKLAKILAGQLDRDCETICVKDYLDDLPGLCEALTGVTDLILCAPLYVDGLPSQVIRFMEEAERHPGMKPERVYLLTNMGLYESRQLVNLFEAVKQWCAKIRCDYAGGLGMSAGELIGTLMGAMPFRFGASRDVARGMDRLALAIELGVGLEDIYAEPFGFPRSLFMRIANTNWDSVAKKNGLKPEDLYRRF